MTRKFINAALLFVLVTFTAVLSGAQTPTTREAATANVPATQLEFVGQEDYELNGTKGTRYKLAVTNRTSHPDFLWNPSHLQACGQNKNPSRTWVEVFASPGDERLGGFCGLRSSEDLGHLWFVVPAGEKGPPCVYIVLTDRQTGKKYKSNRVCSRSFTVVKGGLKGGSQQAAPARDRIWIEIQGWDTLPNQVPVPRGWDPVKKSKVTGPGAPINKQGGQPDLMVKQFLFPPTNDKALRVHVVNTGQSASSACRLLLTVRMINGTAVGRTIQVTVPVLAPGANQWLLIDAKSILPNNVSLQSTRFKLNIDASAIVAESDESNNEVWHNQ